MNKYARFRYQPCIPLGDDGRCCTASKKHASLSRKAATEGMVLLKNESNALPLKKGEKIALVGFGTFEVRARAAREGKNPATGAKIKIAATKVPAFKAGKAFKDAIAE